MATDSEHRKFLYKIARAYHEDGLTQREIAMRFGISRIKVSRLLQQARDEKIVQISIVPPVDTNADLERALEKRYGLLEAVIVTPNSYDQASVVAALGPAAANNLVRCLEGNEIVGLSWGSTLRAVIDALPAMNRPELTVVQLLGGLGRPEAEVHGTDLARRMAQSFNAKLRLIPAPGIVSSKLVRDALMQDMQISDTLALAEGADVALLGIGTPFQGSVVAQANILSQNEITELLNGGAVGDIALRFFDGDGRQVKHEINDRTIGLDLEKMRNIPRRIGVAGGEGKLDVIRGALLGNYINVLITDDLTAMQLLDLDSKDHQSSFSTSITNTEASYHV